MTDPHPDDLMTQALESVLARHAADELDDLLSAAAQGGWAVRWAPVFARLLVARWHTRHEDLARALQDLREPSTVDALFAVADDSAPYSAVDDGRALARKCVWALHDIATPAAIEKLRLLTATSDPETRAHAAHKLADLAARNPDDPPAPYRVARDRRVRRD